MAKGNQDLFAKLFDRAVPGARRWLDAVDKLPDRIDDLQKKLDKVDGAVDDRVSELERGIDKLAKPRPQRHQQAAAPKEPPAEAAQPPEQQTE
jgi:hypothetical protein